ncbi:MAG: hypothetical protein ACI85Q_000142 [Salibacteraceae bacterium]|jgi:hypothetical protein
MKKIFVLATLAFAMSSCYYDNQEDLYPIDSDDCKTDSLTYDGEIGVLINLTCSTRGCHYSTQAPSLINYQEVIDNLDRIQVRALQERTMPPSGPMPECDHKKLTQWIADGAPEN